MNPEDPQVPDMLSEARAKARHLLDELRRQHAEVESNPPPLAAAKLAEGRHAMSQAIRSAQNMLAALDAAPGIADAAGDSTDDNTSG